jgi:ABC-2 type transport system permease protein
MKNNPKKQNGRHIGWLLVKNRLMAQLGINVFRFEKDRHKRRMKIAITLIIGICLLFFELYCGAAAYGYAYLGMTELIPGIAMVFSSLITMFFTIFKANGDLFAFRDYEKLLSLPIPVRTVIYSRLMNMYFWNTLITILVMTPMGIIYAIFMKPLVGIYFLWIAGIFLICLIPTIVAAFFGAVITAIASKFRYASAVSTVLGIAFVVGLMGLSMAMSSGDLGFEKFINPLTGNLDVTTISNFVPSISESLNHLYPPAKLFTDAIVDWNLWSFLKLAFISIFLYVGFSYLLSMKYREINTALTSRSSKADYKMKTLQQGSMRKALYKKTIMRILKSSICATNLLIGCILAMILAIAMTIVGPDSVLTGFDASASISVIQTGASYALAAIISMTNTAAVSLALEGKNIWLIKSLPIPSKTLYDSYLMTNLSFTLPTSVFCGVLFSIALKTSLMGTLIMLLMPMAFSIFTAVMGIFIGNRMAFYDWQEEAHLVKQSLMSITGMLGGMVVIILCGAVATLQLIPIDSKIISFFFILLFLIGAAVIYLKESNRPIKE